MDHGVVVEELAHEKSPRFPVAGGIGFVSASTSAGRNRPYGYFDRNVFDFCGMKLSPKDFNNKAPGRAAHPGFAGRLSMNAEGVRQTAML